MKAQPTVSIRIAGLKESQQFNHLYRQKENDEGTCYGKGVDIDTDQFKNAFAHKKKSNHDGYRYQGSLLGLDVTNLVAQRDDDGNTAQNVDYGKQYHGRREDFF